MRPPGTNRPARTRGARSAAYTALAVVAVAAPLLALTGPPALRAAAGFVAVLTVPGAAIVGFLRVVDPIDEVILAVTVSLVVTILATQVMLWSGLWHPAALCALSALAALALVHHARSARRPATASPAAVAP